LNVVETRRAAVDTCSWLTHQVVLSKSISQFILNNIHLWEQLFAEVRTLNHTKEIWNIQVSQDVLKGRTLNLICCCRRAAQKESEGRMRPAGRTLPIPALKATCVTLLTRTTPCIVSDTACRHYTRKIIFRTNSDSSWHRIIIHRSRWKWLYISL